MNKDTDLGAMLLGCFGIVTGGALVVVLVSMLSIFVNSWALATLWNWVAVPTFHLPVLLYWQAYGIVVIARFLTVHSDTSAQLQRDTETKVSTSNHVISTVAPIVSPIFTVFITWLVLHFLFAVI
jgi:hypothetical protein